MEFVVAADSGTHVYRAHGLERPALLRSLPPAQAGNPHCLAVHAASSRLAALLQTGQVGVWDLSAPAFAAAPPPDAQGAPPPPAFTILPQNGPITRCYFSPRGSFLVTWEPLGALRRVEQPARGDGGPGSPPAEGGARFSTHAENLSVWALPRRPAEFPVTLTKDGKQKLGVNVDHLDGNSGLLIRRVDPGLVDSHNRAVQAAQAEGKDSSEPAFVLPGDLILAVNGLGVRAGAKALADEIQRAPQLQLVVRSGPSGAPATPVARLFAPHISALRWPPIAWTSGEQHALRVVTDEVQVLHGRTLQLLRRIQVDNVSQLSVSPRWQEEGSRRQPLAVWSPAGNSSQPAMVRVFTDLGKGAQPALTKSFFWEAAWVTMRWDPCDGTDVVLLIHSSELTEADIGGGTLHGHGGIGLYLLRSEELVEPIAALIGISQDGAVLDAQWCPADRANTRNLVALQGPQPALVSVFSYLRGSAATVPQRIDLGRFGVRNSLAWDAHGRSICLHVKSMRGTGVSNEADCIDLFDADAEGAVARRAGASVGAGRSLQDGEGGVGPAVTSVDFSPSGEVMLAVVESRLGAELRFLSAESGRALHRLKFEAVHAALWRPAPPGVFPAPEFPAPPAEARLGTLAGAATLEVELHDRETVRRRAAGLRARLREIERLRARGAAALDAQQREKVAQEAEARAALERLEDQAEVLDQPGRLLFEVRSAWGTHQLEWRSGDSCRELARMFCREHGLDLPLATPLAERLELRLQQGPGAAGGPDGAVGPGVQMGVAPRHHGPKPKEVDLQDKESVRRRVRALQKKLREIEKLKCASEGLDQLQREKLASEDEVRRACVALERELDMLERPPSMVFEVETERGVRLIEFRDGDGLEELALRFCDEHGLEDDLVDPLVQHMEQRLRDQGII